MNERKKVVLNDRAVAVKFTTTHQVRYDSKRGLWVVVDVYVRQKYCDNWSL